ncbi:hypothetical protein KCP74_12900 [Salmonella enterica subsp. enterica]|nr:hypothetical protein KCP74_12900 [Salmonella enterica subsp. enterica]
MTPLRSRRSPRKAPDSPLQSPRQRDDFPSLGRAMWLQNRSSVWSYRAVGPLIQRACRAASRPLEAVACRKLSNWRWWQPCRAGLT